MMKKNTGIISVMLLLIMTTAFIKMQKEPWAEDQLMAPKDLASIINSTTIPKPLIIDIGPAGLIKDAINTGPASDKENFKKLKALLSKEKKDRQIVIYCGCCPFQRCPNIRPAFLLLNSMKFTNHKLLNLSTNLKTDWINYGYPMNN